jgi:hypothetical protein
MATFPAIEPSDRSFDFGAFPTSATSSLNGDEVRFNHGEEEVEHDLSISFLRRSDFVLEQIREHYRGQGNGHVSFRLSAIIWQGHSTDSDIVPITGRWKYAAPPDERHGKGGLHDVVVRLQYVGSSSTA